MFNKGCVISEVRGIFTAIATTEAVIPMPQAMSKQWLEKVWEFLRLHLPNDLSCFDGLPMIPLPENELCKLSTERPIMLKQYSGQKLTQDMVKILSSMQVTLICSIPDYVHMHSFTERCILQPDQLARAIILAHKFLKQRQPSLSACVATMLPELKRVLRSKITELSKPETESIKDIVRTLALCETIPESGGHPSWFVSPEKVSLAGPSERFPVAVPEMLIQTSSRDEKRFVELLAVPVKSTAEILIDMMLLHNKEKDNQEDKEKVAQMAWEKFTDYQLHPRFQSTFSQFMFVSTKYQGLVEPCQLINTENPHLKELLSKVDRLPVGKFSDKKYLPMLECLGLRTQPTADELYRMAQEISQAAMEENPQTLSLANSLLRFFEGNQDSLKQKYGHKSLQEAIQDISWVPVEQNPIRGYPSSLSWKGRGKLTVSPRKGVSIDAAFLCGSTCILVPQSDVLQLEEPTIDLVVKHLMKCTMSYSQGKDDVTYLTVVMEVYEYLQNKASPLDIQEKIIQAGQTDWVWKGDGFTSVDQIVGQEPTISVRPYVYTLPSECNKVRELFIQCGMKEKCSYIDVLKMIKNYHDENLYVSEEKRQIDLRMAVSMLSELSDENHAGLDTLLPIHTKDKRLQLFPINECVYCDVEWLNKGIDVDEIDDDEVEDNIPIRVVHEEIPNVISERLGVANIMSRILCVEDLNFGQSESLVDRISSLLKEYRDGLAILKELVQNADDAEATEVKFIYDERQNSDHRVALFDDAMKDLQGPALWAYNDANFTEDDFQNIIKLGGKTKKTATNKIGKFGLGFNAVYNLTDVPCFISGNNMVYFDPHTTYLGRVLPNKSSPGIKLDLKKKRVKKQIQRLPDQFYPFSGILDCDLTSDHYDGTLFRFPLRTAWQADTSKICNIHYSRQEVIKLLKLLHDSCHTLLMFAQNVCTVSVYHIAAGARSAKEMTKLFSIKKRIHSYSDFTIPGYGNFTGTKVLQAASKARELNLKRELKATFVLESKCSTSNRESLVKGWSTSKNDTKQFLVCSTIAGGHALDLASMSPDLVPVAGVAVELDHLQNPCIHDMHMYCFMALPIRSPYPVHVNGYFSITENRTRLCEQDIHDKANSGATWNQHLMEDAVCGAYISLLQELTERNPHPNTTQQKQILDVWPCTQKAHRQEIFRSLEASFYKKVLSSSSNLKLFPSSRGWASFANCVFMEKGYRHSKVGEVALEVLTAHFCGSVVDLPDKIYECIELNSKDFNSDKVFTAEKFLEDVLLPNFNSINTNARTAILLDAVQRARENKLGLMWKLLLESQWVPTTPNGELLKKPSELIDPQGPLKDLYSDSDEQFPVWNLAGIDRACKNHNLGEAKGLMMMLMDSLRELGMKTDEIPWEEVLIRAQTLCNFERKDGMKRATCIVALMERLITRGKMPTDQQQNLLCTTSFLPALQKPHEYPLAWNKGRKVNWISPQESHLMSKTNLIGSVMPLVDKEVFAKYEFQNRCVYQLLGYENRPVPLDAVLEQLDVLKAFNIEARTKKYQLGRIASEVYQYLQEYIRSEEMVPEQLLKLKDEKFLLHEDFGRFVASNEVAYNLDVPCKPYLFHVPDSFKKDFPDLLDFLGIKDNFETSDFTKILLALHEKHLQARISKADQRLVCNVATMLYSLKQTKGERERISLPNNDIIYLPNQAGILCKSSELCYNNCPWLGRDDTMLLCHKDIPLHQAYYLEVKTLQQATVKKHQIGMKFGQKEELTNRLKRLLSGYPCGIEILKELLQNADDAGATRLQFILDPRTHQAEKVFDDEWEALHGPALLVYNDKPFSQQDIKGIQNLGEGSKANDTNKTGKYGVGFNCVYHLTDTPTFLTTVQGEGKRLCALDPHCRYVPDACPECPGQMFDVDKLQKDFPDVFSCYMSEQPDLSTDHGTMFRLPLRNRNMEKSLISNNVFDCTKLKELFEEFEPQLAEMLLFVNSVHTVVLSEVNEQTGKIKPICEVHATLSEDNNRRQKFHSHVKQEMSRVKQDEIKLWDVEMKEVVYEMDIHVTKHIGQPKETKEQWYIAQRFGIESPDDASHRVKVAVEKQDIGLCPRGGVAYKKPSSNTQAPKNKVFCFLPLPLKTDLPVHVNGDFALTYETRHDLVDDDRTALSDWNDLMYRAIIAPAYVTLTVNQMKQIPREGQLENIESVLRSFFCLFPSLPDENEQNLKHQYPMRAAFYQLIHTKHLSVLPMVKKNKKDNRQVDVSWHPIDEENGCPTYFNTLEEEFPPEQSEVSRFPHTQESVDMSESSVYSSTGEHYIPFHQQQIDESDDTSESSMCSSTVEHFIPLHQQQIDPGSLSEILIQCGIVLVHSPIHILRNFQACSIPAVEISPRHVALFMKQPYCNLPVQPRDIQKTTLVTVQNLVILCMYLVSADSVFLGDLPIVLTRDNILRRLGHTKIFHTHHYEAVATIHDCILHEDLLNILPPESFSSLMLEDFANMLEQRILPSAYKGENVKVLMDSLPEYLPENWLAKVWRFIESTIPRPYGHLSEIHKLLEPLKEWALVPCYHTQENYLIPIGKANAVLDVGHGDNTSRTLRNAFRKLPILAPNYEVLTFGKPLFTSSLLPRLVATINTPKDVLWALGNVQEDIVQTDVRFNRSEDRKIVEYFADHLEELKSVPGNFDTLRCLPIYRNINGTQVRLRQQVIRYVIPHGVPATEMNAFDSTSMYVFLREDEKLEALYEYIGCVFKEVEEFYVEFVFKQFNLMSNEGRLVHLEFLRNIISKKDSRVNVSRLVMELRQIQFIEDTEGNLHVASFYYDPHVELFQHHAEPEFLPQEPFNTREWREFLVKLGMISKPTMQHFVEFCTNLATIGKCPLAPELQQNIQKKAQVIVKFLFSEQFPPFAILNAIKDIKFLPSQQVGNERLSLCNQLGFEDGKYPLVCFNGSAFENEADYVWSCVPLIPQQFHPDRFLPHYIKIGDKTKYWDDRQQCVKDILQKLGVMFPVKIHIIAKHVNNVCRSVETKHWTLEEVSDRKKLYESLKNVLTKIFGYLADNWFESNNHFGGLRIIPVKRNETVYFVKASQIVTNNMKESEEIIPYLFRIPNCFGPHTELFLKMGSVEDASADTFARVLKSIHDEANDEKLGPNEIIAVAECFKRLCDLVPVPKKLDLREKELYLLGEDEKLYESSLLLWNDQPSLKSRVKHIGGVFMKNICVEGRVTLLSALDLVQILPGQYQPKFLSSIILEQMSDSVEICNDPGPAAGDLQERLSSPLFHAGLCRLVAAKGKTRNRKDFEVIVEKIQEIKVTTVRRLRTYLVYNSKTVQESVAEQKMFVKKDGDELEVVVDYDAAIETEDWESTFLPRLQEMYLVPIPMNLLVVLFTVPLADIAKKLDKRNILPLDFITESMSLLPRCGDFVPLLDHYLLVHRTEAFRKDQYVAVLQHDPLDDKEEVEPVYVCGKIVRLINPAEQNLVKRKYIVNIGKEKEFCMPQLYSFQRELSESTGAERPVPEIGAKSLDEIKADLTRQLEAAFSLPGEMGRLLSRRLLQVWDPENFPEYKDKARQVFEHLKNEICRLENSKERRRAGGYNYPRGGDRGYHTETTYFCSEPYFDYIMRRNRHHQEQQKEIHHRISQQRSVGGFYFPQRCHKKNPQPALGRCWLKQAHQDFQAARNDEGKFNEWVYFKCHQVRCLILLYYP